MCKPNAACGVPTAKDQMWPTGASDLPSTNMLVGGWMLEGSDTTRRPCVIGEEKCKAHMHR